MRDLSGNLPPNIKAFPNYPLPIVRNADDGVRELVKFQWGMPTPPERVKSKADSETTNIRIGGNGWGSRAGALCPATRFAEPCQ